MAYSGTTEHLELPYMETGDYLSGAEERRRASIIDNMLYVGTYGMRDAILMDAIYSLENITETSCRLFLRASGPRSVLQAVLGYRLLILRNSPQPLELARGAVHWIYLEKNSGFETDATKCSVVSRQNKLSEGLKLLLAKVDFTGTNPVLTTDASIGKKFFANMSGHALSTANPHGVELTQSVLNVTDVLRVSNEEVLPCKYRTIESAGPSGVTLEPIEGFMPVFVIAMPADLSAGETACEIGSDGSIVVYNSGDAGVEIRLKIEGRRV